MARTASDMFGAVPPQNPVDRTIVDVSVLGVKLGYPMLHLLYVLLATARSSLKPQRKLVLENLALPTSALQLPPLHSRSLTQSLGPTRSRA